MPSNSGFEELHPLEERALRSDPVKAWVTQKLASGELFPALTTEEQERIADGEPYCFRCGKPASSFPEYCDNAPHEDRDYHPSAVDYVRREEGTYNPVTNRFACDACYIAIGMPAGPGGWVAP